MNIWTERLGHSRLRSFPDKEGHFWLEQNASKNSKWAKLAGQWHDIAREFEGVSGAYTGRMLIDAETYTPSEATKKFLDEGSVKERHPRLRPERCSHSFVAEHSRGLVMARYDLHRG